MSVNVEIKTGPFQAYIRDVIERRAPEANRIFRERSAQIMEEEVKSRTPSVTGKLISSLRTIITETSVIVGFTAEHAPYVEFGTRPHLIFPVRAKALRFEKEGHIIFAKRVWHPGTRPQNIIAKSREALQKRLPELLRQIWRDFLRV